MLWFKSFHIIAVITWFAAIFYLPRLMVYHCDALAENDEKGDARFKIMERKLLHGIMNPSASVAMFCGCVLWLHYGITGPWLMWKLCLVLLLILFHGFLSIQVKAFAENRNTLTRKHYVLLNEIPVIPLIGGVLLVIFKP